MDSRKILFSITITALLIFFIFPLLTLAEDCPDPCAKYCPGTPCTSYKASGNPLTTKDSGHGGLSIVDISGRAAKGAVGVVGAAVFVMVVIGGIQWLTAQGNDEKIAKAKKTLVWAILGLAVIFLAYAIISYTIGGITKATLK